MPGTVSALVTDLTGINEAQMPPATVSAAEEAAYRVAPATHRAVDREAARMAQVILVADIPNVTFPNVAHVTPP